MPVGNPNLEIEGDVPFSTIRQQFNFGLELDESDFKQPETENKPTPGER
jgi:hypothetical protein